MSDTFVMSSRQAAELDHAFERNGWTPAEVKRLSSGNLLAEFRKVLLGTASIQAIQPAKPVEAPKPDVIELGIYLVDYDETIAVKLEAESDPRRIGWRTNWATDEKFPDARTGVKRYKASVVYFGRSMSDEDVETWCKVNGKRRATPKEGIDLARVSPRPKLDNVMPLAMSGQCFVGADGNRGALCFGRGAGKRCLNDVWLNPDERWGGYWWFLVLATSKCV